MLNQISHPDSAGLHIRQQPLHTIQLVVAWKYLLYFLFLCLRVFFNDHLRIVLDDVTQLQFSQDVFPQIVGHQTVWIGRIPCSVVIAFIEGQKPAGFALQLGAELDPGIVNGKMHHAALELEQQLPWVTVSLVLLNGIVHILLGQLIFQLKGDDRQAVDEDAHIQRQPGGIRGILKLPGHAENVPFKERLRFCIVFRGCQVEHDEVCWVNLDTIAQHINNATLRQLTLQPVQELLFLDVGLEYAQLLQRLRLRILQETEQACLVNRIFSVVVGIGALLVAVIASSAEDLPIEFSPSSLPRTTFKPSLKWIGGRVFPFSLNTGDVISISIDILHLRR